MCQSPSSPSPDTICIYFTLQRMTFGRPVSCKHASQHRSAWTCARMVAMPSRTRRDERHASIVGLPAGCPTRFALAFAVQRTQKRTCRRANANVNAAPRMARHDLRLRRLDHGYLCSMQASRRVQPIIRHDLHLLYITSMLFTLQPGQTHPPLDSNSSDIFVLADFVS
jgi:hypothetical protein